MIRKEIRSSYGNRSKNWAQNSKNKVESCRVIEENGAMTQPEMVPAPVASMDEIQQGWHDLKARVEQFEAERNALEKENKALRFLLEKVIEHRQKSHGELVLLLTSLVSRLPINDVGLLVSKLVEHNTHVSEICAALAKGKMDSELPQPLILKALDQVKRDLAAALKTTVEELIQLESPIEPEMLRSLVGQPDLFFSPAVVRAHRCFVKGQVPRERIIRDFGEVALVLFSDVTTNPKRNPRPKAEEIALVFKADFDAILASNPGLLPSKRDGLIALHRGIQRSKAATEQARAQRNSLNKLSFFIELLHYYHHQNTESPELVFAQRLPTLLEQLVVPGPNDSLDEKLILAAEGLLAFVLNQDYRIMLVNNIGKGGGSAKTLKYVLRLRADKVPDQNDIVPEFVRHLVPSPPQKPPAPQTLVPCLRLIKPEMQQVVVRAIMTSDRIGKADAEALGRAIGKELGLTGLEAMKAVESLPPEMERQIAWEHIKELMTKRSDPAVMATAIRDRLHAAYNADELKQSWIALTEADPILLIRVFCQLPYLPDGRTDPIARALMESYVSRLTHEKYAATYHKVMNSLKNMFKANPNSPTLSNFVELVRWVDAQAANKLGADIGMHVAA